MPPWKKTGLPSQLRSDAEEGRAKLKTTAMTTKSTEGHGRGMGVKDWLPKKDYQKEFPEEVVANDITDEQEAVAKGAGRPAPTDMEKFFAKYGMKPPAWVEKVVLPEWLSRRISGRKKKNRKKKEDEVKDRTPKPLPVPKTIAGMLWIKISEMAARAMNGVRARYQYRKRLRQQEGPGPLEQAATEFIVHPSIAFVSQVRAHGRAYVGVDKSFNTRKQLEEKNQAEDKQGGEPTKVRSFITWHHLEDNQQRIQTVLAILAVVTILLGIAIHERQFRGFIPGWSEDCANPEAPRDACYDNKSCFYRSDAAGAVNLVCQPPDTDWNVLNKLKVANSVMTVWMVYSLYILYRYDANMVSLRNHIDFSDPRLLRYSFLQVGSLHLYCLELLLLMVHQLPYVTHEVIVNSSIFSGRPSVYSLDGILGLLMIGRLLHVLRWYRGYLFSKFQSHHFASRLNDEQMSTVLALRLFILKSPLLASSHFLLGCVAVGSYCYRVAESSTNPTASVYYWDSLWFVVDTLTGLPVADHVIEPKGQFGRTIAVVVRIMGILWYVLLVNALKEWAKFQPDELQVQQWLRLTTRTNVVKVSSIRVVQYVFLFGKNHWATMRQLRRYQRAKMKLRLFMEGDKQRETQDFDAFLRVITMRRTEDVKLFGERMQDVEQAYLELDAVRGQSLDAPARTASMLSTFGKMAAKGMRGAKQAPQKLLYASKQAYKKVAGGNFGVDGVDAEDMVLPVEDMVLPGQAFRDNEGAGEVTTSGNKFGGIEDEFDKETIRKARRASLTMVTGQMNYEVILNTDEKENLRQRTIGSQLSDALKELRALRETNNNLMRMLGEEPEQVKHKAPSSQEEVKLEKWETDMCQRISEAEEQFANLNDSMSECMAQLMVMIGGLYAKRDKKLEKETGTGKSNSP